MPVAMPGIRANQGKSAFRGRQNSHLLAASGREGVAGEKRPAKERPHPFPPTAGEEATQYLFGI